VSPAISVAGSGLWQTGVDVTPFPIDPNNGAVELFSTGDADYGPAFGAMLSTTRTNKLEQELVRTYARSIAGERAITEALATTVSVGAMFPRDPPASVPGNASGWHRDLMNKLATVAQMIAASESVSVGRQVFFVSLGGFDMHGSLGDHRYALQAISDGLTKFYRVMNDLGFGSKVTAFTASDFGRPLRTNGTGSDHGWGGHHFVVGGAVQGGNIYGRAPTMDIQGPDYINSEGTLLPSTSLEQYAGAMASWMGVTTNPESVFPRQSRFGPALTLF
jgi:uncharacterized protein (DUF1501 family)